MTQRNRGAVRNTIVVPNLAEAEVEQLLLGSNCKIENPINAHASDRLLLLVQGNGFSIEYGTLFATSFQPVGGTTTAMEYYFDGSKWWLLYHS